MSGRCSAASTAAMRSVYGASPHAPQPRRTNSWPNPCDSAGLGSRTAYPRAASTQGHHRHDHEFQLISGPPWIQSTSGAGDSAEAPSGSTSHDWTRVPSAAVACTSCRVPGQRADGAGAGQGRGLLARRPRVEPDRHRRRVVGRAQGVEGAAVAGDLQVAVGAVAGQPHRRPAVHRHPEDGVPAVVVGQEVDVGPVGGELRRAGPPVELRRQVPGLPVGHVDDQQRVVRRLGVAGQRLPDADQRPSRRGRSSPRRRRRAGRRPGRGCRRRRWCVRTSRLRCPAGPSGTSSERASEPAVGGEGELLAGAVRRVGVGRQVAQQRRARSPVVSSSGSGRPRTGAAPPGRGRGPSSAPGRPRAGPR